MAHLMFAEKSPEQASQRGGIFSISAVHSLEVIIHHAYLVPYDAIG